jgi:acetyl-CoA carboxylase biotin carboxylase subunit
VSTRVFRKVLVANRGEIAVRIARACREMGLASVAVFSEPDRGSLHVRLADEAVPIGPGPSRESYLRIDRVLDAARATGAEAVHPGYGFLAENAGFARACEEAGLVFIGPRSETIALMGEKTSARREAVAAGVPVVPGTLEPVADGAQVAQEAERIGFPVMLKAAAGGGGKGLRLVGSPSELASAVARARSEASGAFGDDRIYLEKAIERPRHVEVQVLGDHHGNVIHLFERECSIQRRHQKVIEESPSPALTPELRRRMGDLAVALARRTGYTNAGTLEFLVGADREPYFLEMNTRLQVEHPVTEMVTGVDLVKLQIRVAQGEPLPLRQQDVVQRGHAIECRVYAEDPDVGFLPSPGRVTLLRAPEGPGIRHDGWAETGTDVPLFYDPMLAKLIAWGSDREQAIARMGRALNEYEVLGIATSLPFFRWLLRQSEFLEARFHTEFLDDVLQERAGMSFGQGDLSRDEVAAVATCLVALIQASSGVATSPPRASDRSGQPGPASRRWSMLARQESLRE